ncbi:MAG: hypothetical protein RLZ98_2834, partial [Pseudomonadota bacterium]|jgi:hypothetical protein
MAALAVSAGPASAGEDRIGDLIVRSKDAQAPEADKDPRAGEPAYEQAKRLMSAVEALLNETARNRSQANKLPSKNEFIVAPLWTETREDRERKIRDLLDAVLGIVTNVPVVDVQKRIEEARQNIRGLNDRIARAREKQLTAPESGILPGIVSDTVDSLKADIEDSKKRIAKNDELIRNSKKEIADALANSGIKLSEKQADLLLDGVLSGDLVRLVAVFNSARAVDSQLAKLLGASGDNVEVARKYFAMHAALFAMLVHAQDTLIGKIDQQYLPKLDAIGRDIANAQRKTNSLLQGENRPDQKRALLANRKSQDLAKQAAAGYRKYLLQQREQIAAARRRAVHDLKIADNTYETVEASYQLRTLMRNSATSFEALQQLQAPTFEQIFRNEELRREFESITKKLEVPSS